MDNEEIQNFDVEEYLEKAAKEVELISQSSQAGPPMGPVASIAERYDSETLNYLTENITDTFYDDIKRAINEAHMSKIGKRRLLFIADEFTNKEIVVALLKDYNDVKAHMNNFREVTKYSKLSMRKIDASTETFIILAAIETHYKLKLTRAWRGFERIEQQTQRIKSDTTSNYADKTERQAEPSGVKRMLMGLQGGR